jgi:hypothetical protein
MMQEDFFSMLSNECDSWQFFMRDLSKPLNLSSADNEKI